MADDFAVVHTGESTMSLISVTLPDVSQPTPSVQKVLDRCPRASALVSESRIRELAQPKVRHTVRSKSVAMGVVQPVSNALAAGQRRLEPLLESRPGTSDSDAMMGMLNSVTSCIRAVERNVFELNEFVLADGVVAEMPVAEGETPPIQVVKMRLQVTVDGLQAIRSTLEGMGERFEGAVDEALRAAMGDLSSLVPGTPASKMHSIPGTPKNLIVQQSRDSKRLESRASVASMRSLGTTPPNTAPQHSGAPALQFQASVVPSQSALNEVIRQAGSTSEHTAASRLGMQLREWLVERDGNAGPAPAYGGVDAWTAQCHLKLLSNIAAKHAGAFKGLLDNAAAVFTQALFQARPFQLYVPELLVQAEADALAAKNQTHQSEQALQNLRDQMLKSDVEGCELIAIQRQKKRKKARMKRLEAKQIIGHYPLYQQILKKITPVDLFSIVMNHLRRAPKMMDTAEGMVPGVRKHLVEIGMDKLEEYDGAEVVLESILTHYLENLAPMSNEDLFKDDTVTKNETVWRLKAPQLWLKNNHFDTLAKAMDELLLDAKGKAWHAEKVTEAWNCAGLNSDDEMTTDEEGEDENYGSPKGENPSTMMQQQISDYNHRIEQLEAKVRDLTHTLQQTRMREDQLKATAKAQEEHAQDLKLRVTETLEKTLGATEEEVQSCTTSAASTAQLLRSAIKTAAELKKCEERLSHATPRPQYNSSQKVRDSMIQIEMTGLDRKTQTTDDFVSQLVELLGTSLEQKQYHDRLMDSIEARGSSSAYPKFITAHGLGDHVPKYLRWSGRLPLKPIGKRETELLVKQIWAEKQQQEEGTGIRERMDEFFHRFLQARVGAADLVASWAYNIIFSLERHRFDGEGVELFLMVLKGEITESVKQGQQLEVSDVQFKLSRRLQGFGEDDSTSISVVMNVLSNHWGESKTEEDLKSLEAAILSNVKTPEISRPWETLFAGAGSNQETPFVLCVSNQYVHSILQYTIEVEDALRDAAVQDVDRGVLKLSLGGYDAFRALQELSPHKTDQEIEEYVRIGSGLGPDVDVYSQQFEFGPFLNRLKEREIGRAHV